MNPREGATTDSVDGGDNRGGGALTSLPPAAEITPQLISENLAAGREWIQRGLPVFPIAISWDPAKGKTNKRPLTAHGFKDATNDPATLEHLVYDGVTRLKPGEVLACGLVPGAGGFVVFDDDNPPEVARLDRDLRLPPHTYRPKTGSGCEHRWLRKREDVTISNASPWDGQGVDIRADAGYVVCPGTATPWGEWTDGDAQRPWGTFATVPQAIWDRLVSKTSTGSGTGTWKRYDPATHDPQLHPATVELLQWLTGPERGDNRVDPATVTFCTRPDGE
ncbi:MAG: bifunctional DNA primase/polymerase, partial [Actinobacteria bacterium]